MVAGLGTITPASGTVGPAGALVIGLAAGTVCFFATNYMKQKLKIDDSLDVFPVHGVGGILGTMLTGIFASNALGVFFWPRGHQYWFSIRHSIFGSHFCSYLYSCLDVHNTEGG
ncbi:MAG: hypothetical protein CM1200mP24_05580 [Gammaproteobacteria bacterium]|nr:MAG: hypothetical protein CM1200mP24_05580 [Gammaproteobacteria bacterium]